MKTTGLKMLKRLEKLRPLLDENEIDGLFISQPDNRFYLSGFSGSAGYLLITRHDAVIATDFRYYEQVGEQAPDYRLLKLTGGVASWFPSIAAELGIRRLGFESGDVSFTFYRQLSEALKESGSIAELVPLDGLVENLRAVKDAEEIELISRAVDITDRAYEHIKGFIRPGLTEKDIAWELERFQREQGSQAMPFDIIVASGPNAALPHAQPSDRRVQDGDPIVIDMGAKVARYTSDFTRTLCCGKEDDTFKKVYDVVLSAQLTAISLIKEGMTGQEADSFARTVIAEAGYADEFGHSLGHGVGLVTHEQPRLGPNSDDILVQGMVFSIEPGIYLPGWGGVRIEDLATLDNGTIKVLSKGSK